MDNTEDLSARVLVKHILDAEPLRTPVTRSATAAKPGSGMRRSSRVNKNDPGAQTPQLMLRRSLKSKIQESITRKTFPRNRRTASAVLKQTPGPASLLLDDGDTPRQILKNIMLTEPVQSPVINEQVEPQQPQPSPHSTVQSRRPSTEISGFDLPDLTVGNIETTVKRLTRKRPHRSLNVTAFEKRLRDADAADVVEEGETSLEGHSSLSLSSTSLSLKTPFNDVRTERKALQRKGYSRRKVSEEDFAAAVDKRKMGDYHGMSSLAPAQNETANSEGFSLMLSKLSEPNISMEFVHCDTALYAQTGATESNYSTLATQDKPTVMASQIQKDMMEQPNVNQKIYSFPTERSTLVEERDGGQSLLNLLDVHEGPDQNPAAPSHTEQEKSVANRTFDINDPTESSEGGNLEPLKPEEADSQTDEAQSQTKNEGENDDESQKEDTAVELVSGPFLGTEEVVEGEDDAEEEEQGKTDIGVEENDTEEEEIVEAEEEQVEADMEGVADEEETQDEAEGNEEEQVAADMEGVADEEETQDEAEGDEEEQVAAYMEGVADEEETQDEAESDEEEQVAADMEGVADEEETQDEAESDEEEQVAAYMEGVADEEETQDEAEGDEEEQVVADMEGVADEEEQGDEEEGVSDVKESQDEAESDVEEEEGDDAEEGEEQVEADMEGVADEEESQEEDVEEEEGNEADVRAFEDIVAEAEDDVEEGDDEEEQMEADVEAAEDGVEEVEEVEDQNEQNLGDSERVAHRAQSPEGELIVPAQNPEEDFPDGTEYHDDAEVEASDDENKEHTFHENDPADVIEQMEQSMEESEEEEEDDQEEIPLKTPAFVKEKRNFNLDPQASPFAPKTHRLSDAGPSAPGTKPKQKAQRKPRSQKSDPGLPKSYLMNVFKHFAKAKVSADVYPVLKDVMDKFFDRLAKDLEAYALHAGRSTIEVADCELLLRRQGHVNDKVPVEVLIEKYLRMDQRRVLIPIATSGNVVIPKRK